MPIHQRQLELNNEKEIEHEEIMAKEREEIEIIMLSMARTINREILYSYSCEG